MRIQAVFPQDLPGSGGAQLNDFRGKALAVHRYPSAGVDHNLP
jgi:hypothetical protein